MRSRPYRINSSLVRVDDLMFCVSVCCTSLVHFIGDVHWWCSVVVVRWCCLQCPVCFASAINGRGRLLCVCLLVPCCSLVQRACSSRYVYAVLALCIMLSCVRRGSPGVHWLHLVMRLFLAQHTGVVKKCAR